MTTRTYTDHRLVFDGHETDRIIHLIRVGIPALRDARDEARHAAQSEALSDNGRAFYDSMARDFDRQASEGDALMEKIEMLRYVGTLAFTGEAEEVDEMLGIVAEVEAGCDCGKGLYCPLVMAR